MVHHPVFESRRADLARLRVLDAEMYIPAWPIGASEQPRAKVEQVLLHPVFEAGDAFRAALSARRVAPGKYEILPGTQVLKRSGPGGLVAVRDGRTGHGGGDGNLRTHVRSDGVAT